MANIVANVIDGNNINLVVTPPTTQIVTVDRGLAGPTGPAGPTGATGPQGPTGATGAGVVVGGTIGQVLAKASNANYDTTWVNNTQYATIIDDTTTNATRYPLFANATSGNLTTEYTSSTKFTFNPSTGTLIVTNLIIAP